MEKVLDKTLPSTSFTEPDYNQEENRTPPNINADDILRDMVQASGGGISKIKAAKEPHPGTKRPNANSKEHDASQGVQSSADIVQSIQRASGGYGGGGVPAHSQTNSTGLSTTEVVVYSLTGVAILGLVGYVLFSCSQKSEFPKPQAPKLKNPNVQIEIEEVEEPEE